MNGTSEGQLHRSHGLHLWSYFKYHLLGGIPILLILGCCIYYCFCRKKRHGEAGLIHQNQNPTNYHSCAVSPETCAHVHDQWYASHESNLPLPGSYGYHGSLTPVLNFPHCPTAVPPPPYSLLSENLATDPVYPKIPGTPPGEPSAPPTVNEDEPQTSTLRDIRTSRTRRSRFPWFRRGRQSREEEPVIAT
ncbi:uncharacterized protein LOC106458060 [Limulus polyphemus]|uniref:Uncharacterized protein LOC106458060 n=1 Tax=Limulus polyphemus TaxID=6850 RepID=A0ABM1S8E2_LIMPO|nr:uncharacterized protein LOC106458060 [Limulus polyphemus]